MKCCCWTSLTCLLATLLAGCSENPPGQRAEEFSAIQLVANEVETSGPRLAGLIPVSDLFEAPQVEKLATPEPSFESKTFLAGEQVWAFPSDNPGSDSADGVLLELPAVEVTPTSDVPLSSPAATEEEPEVYQPIASLLPPQALEESALEVVMLPSKKTNDVAVEEKIEPVTPLEIDPAAVEKEFVAAVIRDCTAATTGVLTNQRVHELAKTKIRGAYAMANRGGYYAARQELIEVLRMISHAQDARQGIPERTEALAHGLRALEEAEDFVPRGIQLEADLAIEVLCASHRTPIAKQINPQDVLPHQMISSYFRYAQLKLAAAVAGEPAGSMALHALGKLATQLGQVEPEKHRLSQRHAIAFQRAALLAHNGNHLAAHELATLLADAGHFAEAEHLLRQVASRDPNAVVLRNLSLMQEKLGLAQQALANRALAGQMAQRGASGTNNVQWVSPQDFSRSGGVASFARQPQRGPVAQPVWR
ncbi:MAG: hypothetical protein GXP28_07385 [Planctomycetes bacterium]|nr:hypothetical protein [Planctomycetota bacterium]